jgi:hypothetical protein
MNGFETNTLNATISIAENENAKVYIMRNETGEGVVTNFKTLDDINLLYSYIHMNSIISKEQRDADCLAIDYCYEGRLECSLEDGTFVYHKPGDLSIDSRTKGFVGFFFPLQHYRSISILFFLPEAQSSIEKAFPAFPVDLRQLREKFFSTYVSLLYTKPCRN